MDKRDVFIVLCLIFMLAIGYGFISLSIEVDRIEIESLKRDEIQLDTIIGVHSNSQKILDALIELNGAI